MTNLLREKSGRDTWIGGALYGQSRSKPLGAVVIMRGRVPACRTTAWEVVGCERSYTPVA